MKPCIRCGAIDRTPKGNCKPCNKILTAKWRVLNAEKHKATGDRWRAAVRERVRAGKATVSELEKREKTKAAKVAWEKVNRPKRRIQIRLRRWELRGLLPPARGPRRYCHSDGGKYSMYL